MNTQATHTPGPWEVRGVYVRTKITDTDSHGYLIADVFNGDGVTYGAQAIANACLIEQAPALLDALRRILPHAQAQDCGAPDIAADLAFAHTTIAKATEARP